MMGSIRLPSYILFLGWLFYFGCGTSTSVQNPPGPTEPSIPIPAIEPDITFGRGPFFSSSMSPTGRFLAAGGSSQVVLFDVFKREKISTLKAGPGDILGLAFSPDGKTLAGGGYKSVRLWEVESGEVKADFNELSDYITTLEFSPNGRILSAGSKGEKAEIYLWDVLKKNLEARFPYSNRYAEVIRDLAFSPDGKRMASTGLDRKIRLWNVQSKSALPIQIFFDPFITPLALSFGPSGKLLAAGTSEGRLMVYDLNQGKQLKRIDGHQSPVISVAFSSDGEKLISVDQDKIIRYWNLSSGFSVGAKRIQHEGEAVTLSSNGDQAVSFGFSGVAVFSLRKEKGIPPIIAIASPQDLEVLFKPQVRLSGKIADDQGVEFVKIDVNGISISLGSDFGTRDLKVQGNLGQKEIVLDELIDLQFGNNHIIVMARDLEGLTRSHELSVSYLAEKEVVRAAVIGISDYQNVDGLKYADQDAISFYNYLIHDNQIPESDVILLLNEEATLQKIKDVLGVDLKRKTRKQDTVIIFYAGHGAPEPDPHNPDGDGFEKYLLPYDADPDRLYSTALPMTEISNIFSRISAERMVLIQDTCYAGNSRIGGRTIQAGNFRASLSGGFLDRLARGKGRILLSASEANEVSIEKDDLGHGVFTYYLLEAFSKGDIDGDGLITTGEAFRYVSKKVPDATRQNQHPVIKGEMVREIVLGKVRNMN